MRCVALDQFAAFAKVVELEFLKSDLIPLFVHLAQDRHESVRLMAVKAFVTVIGCSQDDDVAILLLPTLRVWTSDSSSAVRIAIALKMHQLPKIVGPKYSKYLIETCKVLMLDTNAEVEEAISSKIRAFTLRLDTKARVSLYTGAPLENQFIFGVNQTH